MLNQTQFSGWMARGHRFCVALTPQTDNPTAPGSAEGDESLGVGWTVLMFLKAPVIL